MFLSLKTGGDDFWCAKCHRLLKNRYLKKEANPPVRLISHLNDSNTRKEKVSLFPSSSSSSSSLNSLYVPD